MRSSRFYLITTLTLLALLGFLLFRTVSPFFISIAWAVILTIVFFPLYLLILRYVKKDYLASVITTFIIILFVVGPVTYFGVILIKEIKEISTFVTEERLNEFRNIIKRKEFSWLVDKVMDTFNLTEEELTTQILKNLDIFIRKIISNLSQSITNMVGIIFNFILTIFTVFFFLKDGPVYLKKVLNYLPFSEGELERLTRLIKDIIISTIYGGVLVAFIQASIGGITFYLLGISTPVIWASMIAIASFIPILGAFSVWGPIAGYLFLTGSVFKGVILTIVGGIGISTIDNILKPIIIGGRTKMPAIVIFFSVLGGIKEFGLIGLVAGPLIVALFVSLIEILRKIE